MRTDALPRLDDRAVAAHIDQAQMSDMELMQRLHAVYLQHGSAPQLSRSLGAESLGVVYDLRLIHGYIALAAAKTFSSTTADPTRNTLENFVAASHFRCKSRELEVRSGSKADI